MRDVADVLQATLDSFVAKLGDRRGCNLPRRQFIQAGSVAYDCEQLVVHTISGPYLGLPGTRQPSYAVGTNGIAMIAMDIGVTLVRDVQGIDNAGVIPSASVITRASLNAACDATALTETFFAAMGDNSIASNCDTANYGGIVWNGPQGGFLGTQLTFAIQL